jgi:hypothetical protein
LRGTGRPEDCLLEVRKELFRATSPVLPPQEAAVVVVVVAVAVILGSEEETWGHLRTTMQSRGTQ